MIKKKFSDFALLFHNASEKGVLLLGACILALVCANSPLREWYFAISGKYMNLNGLSFSFAQVVNDFLMVFFFLMVGLEIKREMVEGHLSTKEQRVLPIIAAISGVVCPVLIYAYINADHPLAIRGWAIPAATDIAFALGMLALLGKNLPTSLRVFLTALAIIDDLIAVIIIALFYSTDLALEYLLNVGILIAILLFLCKKKFKFLSVYLLLGAMLWYFFLKTGIHATVAGVTLGMLIPLKVKVGNYSPLNKLEKSLQPCVAYLILPLFAFVNSGVNLSNVGLEVLHHNVTLGIILGLFFGKQCGIFLTVWLLIKTKISRLPQQSNFFQFYGVTILCGIGFTMSLFVGNLAFAEGDLFLDQTKVGVLVASLLSAVYGGIILYLGNKKND